MRSQLLLFVLAMPADTCTVTDRWREAPAVRSKMKVAYLFCELQRSTTVHNEATVVSPTSGVTVAPVLVSLFYWIGRRVAGWVDRLNPFTCHRKKFKLWRCAS